VCEIQRHSHPPPMEAPEGGEQGAVKEAGVEASAEGGEDSHANGPPPDFSSMTFNEMNEVLRRLDMTEDEAAEYTSRHMSARAVAALESEKIAMREGRDPSMQRYMDLQLGGPLSAVRSPSSSGNATPTAHIGALLSRRGKSKRNDRPTV